MKELYLTRIPNFSPIQIETRQLSCPHEVRFWQNRLKTTLGMSFQIAFGQISVPNTRLVLTGRDVNVRDQSATFETFAAVT